MTTIPTTPDNDLLELTIVFNGEPTTRELPSSMTFESFQRLIYEESNVPTTSQKLLAPKVGLIKGENLPQGFATPLATVFATPQSRKRIILMGTPQEKLDEVHSAEKIHALQRRQQKLRYQKYKERARAPSSTKQGVSTQESRPKVMTLADLQGTTSNVGLGIAGASLGGDGSSSAGLSAAEDDTPSTPYTFHKLVPLPFLPNPEKSRDLLRQLRDDRGIRAIMKKYKWSVPILTELDPSSNTASNGAQTQRLLGLNRNQGQIIELRLRTDAYDGWLKFKDVRKVLCHELTHNVHGPHDDKFWKMFHVLEREVVDLDPFGKGGRKIDNIERYSGPGFAPGSEDEEEYFGLGREDVYDEGGWIGSSHVLGTTSDDSTPNQAQPQATGPSSHSNEVKSILRQAALDRERRLKERSTSPPIPPPKVSKKPTPEAATAAAATTATSNSSRDSPSPPSNNSNNTGQSPSSS